MNMTFLFSIGCFLVFASLFTGVGSFLAYKGQEQQSSFDTVTGKITKSEIVKSSHSVHNSNGPGQQKLLWMLDITYNYKVDNHSFTGNVFSWDNKNLMERSEEDKEPPRELTEMMLNYSLNSVVDIYYSKKNPEKSFLVQSSKDTYIYLSLISMILLICGSAIMFVTKT